MRESSEERKSVGISFFVLALCYLGYLVFEFSQGWGSVSTLLALISVVGAVLVGLDQFMVFENLPLPMGAIGFAAMAFEMSISCVRLFVTYLKYMSQNALAGALAWRICAALCGFVALAIAAGILYMASVNKEKTKTVIKILYPLLVAGLFIRALILAWIVVYYLCVDTYAIFVAANAFQVLMAFLLASFAPNAIPDELKPIRTITRPDGTVVALRKTCYFNMGLHVLLLIITCNCWTFKWTYRTTKYTNNVTGFSNRIPFLSWFMYLFIPFYFLYWIYNTAQRADVMAKENGIGGSDIAVVCLLLMLFGFWFIPPIMIQDKLNKVVLQGNKPL